MVFASYQICLSKGELPFDFWRSRKIAITGITSTFATCLADGSFAVWKGPIVGQDGKELLAKDAVADDKFLGGVNFYVKGVEGKVPGADKK